MIYRAVVNAAGSTLAGGMDTCSAVQEPLSGLHEGLSVTWQRIAQVNSTLEATLQRIHGPLPVSAQATGKNPETPSILTLASNVEQELGLLEKLTADLCKFIG